MKYQILYTNKMGKFFLYGLCFFLIFLLGLAYSSIVTAQVYDWGNSQNFLNPEWVFVNDKYSWGNNFNTPSIPTYPGEQGRSGLQSQAPPGFQVLSARNKYILYAFWSRPNQYQGNQGYYSIYQNPYQASPYSPNPLMPFYDIPYWTPIGFSASIGPSMFSSKPYWTGTGGGMESSSGIGPSMFTGQAYWAPMGGNVMILGPN